MNMLYAIQGEARVVMVNSQAVLSESFINYQTDIDDPMMERKGAYRGHGNRPYKNSKVLYILVCVLALVLTGGSAWTS